MSLRPGLKGGLVAKPSSEVVREKKLSAVLKQISFINTMLPGLHGCEHECVLLTLARIFAFQRFRKMYMGLNLKDRNLSHPVAGISSRYLVLHRMRLLLGTFLTRATATCFMG